MATQLKEMKEKDAQIEKMKNLMVNKNEELEISNLELLEAKDNIDTAALNLHHHVINTQNQENKYQNEISELNNQIKKLNLNLNDNKNLLKQSNKDFQTLQFRSYAIEQISLLWQNKFIKENEILEEEKETRLRQTDELREIFEERCLLESKVIEQESRINTLESVEKENLILKNT